MPTIFPQGRFASAAANRIIARFVYSEMFVHKTAPAMTLGQAASVHHKVGVCHGTAAGSRELPTSILVCRDVAGGLAVPTIGTRWVPINRHSQTA